jgi:hypothetical protein
MRKAPDLWLEHFPAEKPVPTFSGSAQAFVAAKGRAEKDRSLPALILALSSV